MTHPVSLMFRFLDSVEQQIQSHERTIQENSTIKLHENVKYVYIKNVWQY